VPARARDVRWRMGERFRIIADRTLRFVCVLFALAAFVYDAPSALPRTASAIAVFVSICLVGWVLSRLVVPLLTLANFRRRTGDPGSIILDAALFAFVFALFGGYAAALLHVFTSLTLRSARVKHTLFERLLRAAPGVPFWFFFGYVRGAMHGAYLMYSAHGFLVFVTLIVAAHADAKRKAEVLQRHVHEFPLGSEDIYFVKAIGADYLPRTLDAYLALPPRGRERVAVADGKTPLQELRQQLGLLDTNLDEIAAVFERQYVDPLLANRRLWAERPKPTGPALHP